MSKVFSIYRQMQNNLKNKNKCKEMLYSLSGQEEKALHIPADTSRIPPFPSSHVKAASTHRPTSLWTKEDQPMFPLRPQIWEQVQQPESHTIIESDFAILFAPPPPLKLKPHVSMSHYCSQNPSPPPSSPVSSAPSWHQGHSPYSSRPNTERGCWGDFPYP